MKEKGPNKTAMPSVLGEECETECRTGLKKQGRACSGQKKNKGPGGEKQRSNGRKNQVERKRRGVDSGLPTGVRGYTPIKQENQERSEENMFHVVLGRSGNLTRGSKSRTTGRG